MMSKNAAVATFVNSQYIRDGGLSGLVVGCLTEGFQLTVQGCGFGVITLNITGGINLFDPLNYYTIQ
ncbi:hypothetical protein DPMN_185696 [Dreissena polymorpha]|uniref:Uncharacterized protein n=2 Tax=Dreissena polymorpha TaxID=45954 RepID=A0A9D4I8N5_DREPO|nr:hypothetical protein DPMN_185696 [Dreissena polymorpha]